MRHLILKLYRKSSLHNMKLINFSSAPPIQNADFFISKILVMRVDNKNTNYARVTMTSQISNNRDNDIAIKRINALDMCL